MKHLNKVLLGTLAAVTLLAAVASSASANRISISNQSIRAIWSPLFIIVPNTSAAEFQCQMTLEGSFHSRTMSKVATSLIGYITRAAVSHPCTRNGEMWVHNGVEAPLGATPGTSLPWHMTYQSFSGTLPNISEVRILLRGIRVTALWRLLEVVACLAVFGNATESIISEWKVGAGGRIIAIQFLEQPLRKRETAIEFSCQNEIKWNSSATNISLLGTTTAIFVTLI
jgi:hypothetical protein